MTSGGAKASAGSTLDRAGGVGPLQVGPVAGAVRLVEEPTLRAAIEADRPIEHQGVREADEGAGGYDRVVAAHGRVAPRQTLDEVVRREDRAAVEGPPPGGGGIQRGDDVDVGRAPGAVRAHPVEHLRMVLKAARVVDRRVAADVALLGHAKGGSGMSPPLAVKPPV